jgi:hypothetical protein
MQGPSSSIGVNTLWLLALACSRQADKSFAVSCRSVPGRVQYFVGAGIAWKLRYAKSYGDYCAGGAITDSAAADAARLYP